MADGILIVQRPAPALVQVSAPASVSVIKVAPATLVVGPKGDKGEQGVPGVAGAPGAPGGAQGTVYVAPFPMSGHRVVIADETGSLAYADCSIPSHALRVVGVTVNAADTGGSMTVQALGSLTEPSWNFDVSNPVYLSNSGLLTQVAPVAPNFSMVIGAPISQTSLFVRPQPPISQI